ncbi:assimilatory nitrate reductase [Sulfuriferula plumbiphila]|uniref:Assimilatory nitrate reductase n=1 Tax=Sulfuriferula plumbiphila TaxID=171865 RepID=A0A512L9N4_9PROT|nr:assimilatory nitrate reductase [Sulfuriferula plumbiphila]GEP31167.1 assimilatory nitrate reductase [Sulfuriferula plumbiphila]
MLIETDGARITGVRGDPDHPANFGRLCTKGASLHLAAAQLDARALYPALRSERGTPRERVSWDSALDHAAGRFAEIIRNHGADAVGFYISGQLLTEDYYVFNKLAKGLVGTNNVDTNSRLCMSSAVSGYKATLGADAPPACYEDIAATDCLFIAGSNTAYAHPIVYRRIEDARKSNPDLKVIVVDPRRTDTAREADLHLPILPGTDVALFNAMLHVMLWENMTDAAYIAAHTSGFDALRATVREYTPESVAGLCGVPATDIITAARWFGQSPATLSLYCQGLNQSSHGTDKNAALINLHLATGQIGRPGTGPFSLTGQPNAMGGREVGGMANLLSAHRDLANPAHRAEVAALWGVDSVPEIPGKTALEMFEAVARGEIKALWIACTNPAQSLPNQALVRAALEAAEFVVVQEVNAFTETADYADLLLPAAAWGEKEGTVTNSERRITHLKAAIAAPGEARPDWEIAADFARRLGAQLGKPGTTLFPYVNAEAVFNEHRASTRGRDLDITGLSYALLDEQGPQQWPFPEGATTGKVRLYADGVYPTADGRARFASPRYLPTAEVIDARYPLHFNTGRLRDQWHGMSRTGMVARLFSHVETPVLSMHADDMARRSLKNGDLVRVKNRRGELLVPVEASEDMRVGQVFMPMHWGGRYMSGFGVNTVTADQRDPVSRQPELKHAVVQVEKAPLPWHMAVMRRDHAVARMLRIQPLLARFDYASCGLYGRDNNPLLVLRVAHGTPLSAEMLAEIDTLLDMQDEASIMRYDDPRRGISKRVMVEDGRVVGVRLTGETAARDWLKEMMAEGAEIAPLRAWVLAPLATPPVGSSSRGYIVCNCLNIPATQILEAVAQGADLPVLQARLKCGTECGSCVPELRRMVLAHKQEAA